MKVYCGMDFGTSNSTVGVHTKQGIEMVPLERIGANEPELTLPSAIFFPFEEESVCFGREAIREYTEGERGRLMRSMKSILGTSLMHEQTNIKGTLHTFADIIGYYLQHLKTHADHCAGQELQSVVMGRPVRFNDDDDALDLAAEKLLAKVAQKVGFREVSFQYEPIAAAYDYESTLTHDEIVCIVDIGGGTSDFSLIQLHANPNAHADRANDVLANHGIHIGGTDFDQRLSMQTAMPFFGLDLPLRTRPEMSMPRYFYSDFSTWHRIHALYELETLLNLKSFVGQVVDRAAIERFVRAAEQKLGHAIAAEVERSKIALSDVPETQLNFHFLNLSIGEQADYQIGIAQDVLREAIQSALAQLDQSIAETLVRGGVNAHQVDAVFLTGGSTALPAIQHLVATRFPDAKRVNTDLFCAVGRGLAIEAKRRYG